MSAETKRVAFHLPVDLLAALDARCRANGQQRSEALRALVDESLGEEKRSAPSEPSDIKAVEADATPRPVFFRLNGPEAAATTEAAAGYRGIAAWVTALVRREILCAAMISDEDRKLLVDNTAQLRRIGINLNQIAHRMNVDERTAVTDVEVELLHETAAFIGSHSKRIDSILAQSQRPRTPRESINE
jgi:hypothetical protein